MPKLLLREGSVEQAAHESVRDKETALKLRGEGGSGLADIGVTGKEHAVAQSSLMVSSDSDSDGDTDEELFGIPRPELSRFQQTRQRYEEAVQAGPVRKIKQVRSQKDVRARLAPDSEFSAQDYPQLGFLCRYRSATKLCERRLHPRHEHVQLGSRLSEDVRATGHPGSMAKLPICERRWHFQAI